MKARPARENDREREREREGEKERERGREREKSLRILPKGGRGVRLF